LDCSGAPKKKTIRKDGLLFWRRGAMRRENIRCAQMA
jgi:hypothetical protein